MQSFIIAILFVLLSFSNYAWCKGARPFDHSKMKVVMSSSGAANDLLNALKWDVAYDKERTQEVKYLLAGIDGPSFEGLTSEQKKQVLVLMQNIVINQIIEDKQYFRKYLIEQYAQFFTVDELNNLTNYYKTEVIQIAINNKIDSQNINIATVKEKLVDAKPIEKNYIENVAGSYVYTRYIRFQEKIKPKLDRMIVDRLKEVLNFVISKIPEIIIHVKTNSPMGETKIKDAPSITQ